MTSARVHHSFSPIQRFGSGKPPLRFHDSHNRPYPPDDASGNASYRSRSRLRRTPHPHRCRTTTCPLVHILKAAPACHDVLFSVPRCPQQQALARYGPPIRNVRKDHPFGPLRPVVTISSTMLTPSFRNRLRNRRDSRTPHNRERSVCEHRPARKHPTRKDARTRIVALRHPSNVRKPNTAPDTQPSSPPARLRTYGFGCRPPDAENPLRRIPFCKYNHNERHRETRRSKFP